MVPVKSPKEYYVQQEVIVLFCETVERYDDDLLLKIKTLSLTSILHELESEDSVISFLIASPCLLSQGPEVGLSHTRLD